MVFLNTKLGIRFHHEVIERQLFARCTAVLHASACAVKVGFRARLYPLQKRQAHLNFVLHGKTQNDPQH